MTILAIDIETTGLKEECNVLTAYFTILDSELNKVSSLYLKIKHEYYVLYMKALEVNQIDLIEHDKTAIPKGEAILKLEYFLKKHQTNSKYTILGHNVSFDIKLLTSNGIFHKELLETYISGNVIDTMILAQELRSINKIPKKQPVSLSKLCYYYDLADNINTNFHDAEYDVEMTIELYKKLKLINEDHK